jgi:hypothetical protein
MVAMVFLVVGYGGGLACPRSIGVLIDTAVDGGAEAISRAANRFEAGEVVALVACAAAFRHGGKNAWSLRVSPTEIIRIEGDSHEECRSNAVCVAVRFGRGS